MMGFERFVARRQVRALRRRRRVAITARIASTGVGVGVAACIVVLSVMNGFSGLLWERLLTLTPHLIVRDAGRAPFVVDEVLQERLLDAPTVKGVARFLSNQGFMMRRGMAGTHQAGSRVLAVDGDGLAATSDLARFMWDGSLDLGPQPSEGVQRYGMVMGSFLADKLGASVGSEVRLAFPPQEIGSGRTPPVRRYVVTGVFSTGYSEFDSALSLISLEAAARDLATGLAVEGLRVRLDDPLDAAEVAQEIASKLPEGVIVSPWMAEHGSLYASIQLEKWSFYLGLTLIVVIAGLNIVSIVSMSVAEQRREIGILKAMGTSGSKVARIYAMAGLQMGVRGVVGGVIAGVAVCFIQILFEPLRLPADVFIVNALPVELRWTDVLITAGTALALSLVFAIVPARSAASLDPVEAVRI